MQLDSIPRVNWVVCPKCKFKYYLSAPMLAVEGVPAICPKCRNEFEPRPHLIKQIHATRIE